MDKETFKSIILEKNIRFMPHHCCAICNCTVGYYFYITPNNEILATFDSSCDCGCSPETPCPLEDPAEWYDNLPDELKFF